MDIFLGFLACIAAALIGVYLAKKQARAFSNATDTIDINKKLKPGEFPPVNYFDYGDMRFLHLGSPAVQGSMRISQPFDIHLEYQQRMMGWMLFTDLEKIHQLQAMQLGLGAASLTKYCNVTLGMATTAIELNPQVIETCRLWFNLPNNNDRLNVVVGDAAKIVQSGQWKEKVDVLQVDLYDQDAEQPVLDTAEFYSNCKQLLTENGCMTVNIFGRQSNIKESAKKLRQLFGPQAVWLFKPTKAGNSIIVALRKPRLFSKHELTRQVQAIEARWHLPSKKWLNTIAISN